MKRRLLFNHSDLVEQFVGSLILGGERGFGKCTGVGVLNNETLIAGCIYHNWNPERGTIEITGAGISPIWLTRTIMRELLTIPYRDMNCQLVFMNTSAKNTQLIRKLRLIGFKTHPVARMFGRDENGFVCSMSDTAWLKSRFNVRHNV